MKPGSALSKLEDKIFQVLFVSVTIRHRILAPKESNLPSYELTNRSMKKRQQSFMAKIVFVSFSDSRLSVLPNMIIILNSDTNSSATEDNLTILSLEYMKMIKGCRIVIHLPPRDRRFGPARSRFLRYKARIADFASVVRGNQHSLQRFDIRFNRDSGKERYSCQCYRKLTSAQFCQ